MKKSILVFSLLFGAILTVKAQTATNFTATDCNGVQYNLFNELDAGKVIVLASVMPCGSCLGPSLTAYNVSQSYATSNPGKVLYFLCDDFGDTPCSALNGWANSSNIGPNRITFSTSAISMTPYGGAAMPRILVFGGANHTVYYNEANGSAGNATAIQNAINLALTASGIEEISNLFNLNVSPNPAKDILKVSFNLNKASDVSFKLINAVGETAKAFELFNQSQGENIVELSIEEISTGMYFLQMTTGSATELKRIQVIK